MLKEGEGEDGRAKSRGAQIGASGAGEQEEEHRAALTTCIHRQPSRAR